LQNQWTQGSSNRAKTPAGKGGGQGTARKGGGTSQTLEAKLEWKMGVRQGERKLNSTGRKNSVSEIRTMRGALHATSLSMKKETQNLFRGVQNRWWGAERPQTAVQKQAWPIAKVPCGCGRSLGKSRKEGRSIEKHPKNYKQGNQVE